MAAWLQAQLEQLSAKHGTVPPPWVIFNEHPVSLCWRMGGGESHLMLWWPWWEQQAFTEEQKIAYFKRWPPHCWLGFLIEAVWGVNVHDDETGEAPSCFARTTALGFGSEDAFNRDFDDEKWLTP